MHLVVKVVPQSSLNKIVGLYQGMLKVHLKGVPEKGKLNELLIDFLSECFGIPKSGLMIKQGFTSPVKRLEIQALYDLKVEIYLNKYKEPDSQEPCEID